MHDLYESWAADARRRGLAERYIQQQKVRIDHFTAFADGRPANAELVRAWLEKLAETGIPRETGKGRPCSPKTLNNHLAAMRAFWGWCVRARYIAVDPSDGVAWARAPKRKGRVLSARQVWAIINAAQQDEQARKPRCKDKSGRPIMRSAYYRVLVATGMRADAADGLRVRDFELNAEPPRIVVPAELDKSDTERSIIISDSDRAFFAERLAGLSPGHRPFVRPHYRVLYSDSEAAGVAVKDSQGRGVGLHCFRRWHGTEMDRQGFSVEQIRQRLGHKTVLSTMGYLVRELEEQQGVAEKLALEGEKCSDFSTKPIDNGHGIADDGDARNDTHTTSNHADNRGVRSAAVVPSSRTLPTPRDPATTPGTPLGGRQPGRPSTPADPESESGRRFKSCRPDSDDEVRLAASLLHRYFDLLDRGIPGRKAEGYDEQDR